jgi:hypothetical protein
METSEPGARPDSNEPSTEMQAESNDTASASPAEKPPELDQMKLQMMLQQIRDNQNMPMAILGGAVAAVVGAAVWAAVTVATGWQIGFMAIGVGFLVGWTVRKMGQGIDQSFGIVGAVMSLFGCVLGNYLSICGFIAQEYGVGYFDVLGTVDWETAFNLMAETFNVIDILFYALALYYGYKYSIRGLTEEELRSVIKR